MIEKYFKKKIQLNWPDDILPCAVARCFYKISQKSHIFAIQVHLVKSSYLPPNPQKLKYHWHRNLILRGNTWKQKGSTVTNNSCVNDNNEVNWSTSKNKFKTCGLFIWFLLMYHQSIWERKLLTVESNSLITHLKTFNACLWYTNY